MIARRMSDRGTVPTTDVLAEALMTTEAKMRRRIDLLSEVVFETDADGSLQYLNKAWTNTLGYDIESSLGQTLADFAIPEDRLRLRARIAAVGTQPYPDPFEFHLVAKGASLVTMELTLAPLSEGGVVGTLYNITQRKLAQGELSKLSLVASFTDSLVIITDAGGKIEWVNQAFVRKTEYGQHEAIGRKPGWLLHGKDTSPDAVQKMRDGVLAAKPVHAEILNYSKSGRPYWVSIFINPIFNSMGEVERFIAVENDITVIREMKGDLEAARDAAEHASHAKSAFLASVSHEIRTPLNGVLGMASLLLDGQLYDDQRERACIIKSSGEALLTIVNDILDYSKIESGHFTLATEEFTMRSVVEETVSLFRGNAEAKGLKLAGSYDGEGEITLLGDRGRIRQVLMNLVSNAVKFTPEGAINVEVVQRSQGDRAHISVMVTDTGIGIAANDLNRLFVLFSQVDDSRTRKVGGTGLGLAISKQLVEMMGGSIGVHTDPGVGSTFYFKLDLPLVHLHSPKEKHETALKLVELRGLKILIAEDNSVNQIVLREMLTNLGSQIDIVNNGIEAVDAAKAKHYDCVLMDVHMPEMDGIEATREIRRISRVPVIAVTANVLPDQIKQCSESGMNGFIQKPISQASLKSELARVLQIATAA